MLMGIYSSCNVRINKKLFSVSAKKEERLNTVPLYIFCNFMSNFIKY